MSKIKPEVETFAKIKVVGVGEGGGNAIDRMIKIRTMLKKISRPMICVCLFVVLLVSAKHANATLYEDIQSQLEKERKAMSQISCEEYELSNDLSSKEWKILQDAGINNEELIQNCKKRKEVLNQISCEKFYTQKSLSFEEWQKLKNIDINKDELLKICNQKKQQQPAESGVLTEFSEWEKSRGDNWRVGNSQIEEQKFVNQELNDNVYRNKKYHFRIKFPVGWEIKDGDGEHIVKKSSKRWCNYLNSCKR